MAFCELHIYSENLGMQTTVNVILPQRKRKGEIGVASNAAPEQYKCLYLLHGLSDDQTIWMRRTSIERYAAQYGICVVMPFAARSYYTDMHYGEKYYSFIAKELPAAIQEFFNVSPKREDNFVAGLSMGGYGALKIGLRECDRFCAAAGLSAASDIVARREKRPELMKALFGEEMIVPEEDDLFKLAEKQATNPLKPRIYMGVGTEDSLYEENQRLKATLEALPYDFTYRESAGAHTWAFWDEYIQYVLTWLLG